VQGLVPPLLRSAWYPRKIQGSCLLCLFGIVISREGRPELTLVVCQPASTRELGRLQAVEYKEQETSGTDEKMYDDLDNDEEETRIRHLGLRMVGLNSSSVTCL
jgi:hypothetical protein